MGIEIERKFLVKGKPWSALTGTPYRQGYLTTDPERTVRVRIAGECGCLTIKGASSGLARAEFEYPIPLADAEQLLDQLCPKPQIEKTRYQIVYAGLTWEVDVFTGENAGLVIAEVELEEIDQPVELPAWVGREVTGDRRFFNAYLTRHPYLTWADIPFR
jgi:adenylate cyclase